MISGESRPGLATAVYCFVSVAFLAGDSPFVWQLHKDIITRPAIKLVLNVWIFTNVIVLTENNEQSSAKTYPFVKTCSIIKAAK